MRGIVTEPGKKGLSLRQFPDPQPGPHEVLIRVEAAGVCGSDLGLYRGDHTPDVVEAGQHIIGHEAAGTVVATGREVAGLVVGDRVTVYHLTGCGACRYCRRGQYQFCETRRIAIGFHQHGSDADLLCCDALWAVPVPTGVSFADAAIASCVGTTAMCALRKGAVAAGTTVVVSGLGPVGLCAVTLSKALGARVMGLDMVDLRLGLARDIGCDEVVDLRTQEPVAAVLRWTDGLGAPAIVECSGSPDAQRAALRAVAIKGRVVLVGHNRELTIDPSYQLIIRREVALVGSWVFSRAELVETLGFLAAHGVSFEPIVTHRFPLEQAELAFDLFDRKQTGKVVLTPAART